MKINKLDLAKIISDFMFLNIENPEEKASVVFKVKHKLTAHGFEKYMQYYFMKIRGYKVKLNGRTNEFDGGVDLKGIKEVDGKMNYLVVQCKKYSVKDITEVDVKNFHSSINIDNYLKYKDITSPYYITTSKFTDKAIKFAKKGGIRAINFLDIYNLQQIYSIDIFEKDLKNDEGVKEYKKSFNQEQLLIELDNKIYDTIGVTDNEVFALLKQVRRDYSNYSQLNLGDIAKNDTLKLLSNKRPHNIEALKEAISDLSTREKNKLIKHGDIFIDRLKYINKDDEVEDEFEKSFFSKMVEFMK